MCRRTVSYTHLDVYKRQVYKLAAIKEKDDEDFVPKIKLSENVEKVTNPGNKTVYRIYDKATGKIRADLICLADETFDTEKDMIIFDPMATWKKTKIAGGTYTPVSYTHLVNQSAHSYFFT